MIIFYNKDTKKIKSIVYERINDHQKGIDVGGDEIVKYEVPYKIINGKYTTKYFDWATFRKIERREVDNLFEKKIVFNNDGHIVGLE